MSEKNLRILIVTPEVRFLPEDMGNKARYLAAKAGGLADVSAALINALHNQGADVHVALPDYRRIFNGHMDPILGEKLETIQKKCRMNGFISPKTGFFSICTMIVI